MGNLLQMKRMMSVNVNKYLPSEPPAAAAVPPPGYYWVRVAHAVYTQVGNGPGRYRWTEPVWCLVLVLVEHYQVFGDEEVYKWAAPTEVVVEVGPKVEQPA